MKLPRLPRRALALAVLAAFVWGQPASGEGFAPLTLTPAEIRLEADASRPGGMAIAILAGDMAKPGLYAARIRMPAGLRVEPHFHPENRVVVVLSGTLHIGFGERFEPERLRAMPAGSFFVEPAGVPHFARVGEEDAIVQVSGVGPSGTTYLHPGAPGH